LLSRFGHDSGCDACFSELLSLLFLISQANRKPPRQYRDDRQIGWIHHKIHHYWHILCFKLIVQRSCGQIISWRGVFTADYRRKSIKLLLVPTFRRSFLTHNNFHTFLRESRLFSLHSRLNWSIVVQAPPARSASLQLPP